MQVTKLLLWLAGLVVLLIVVSVLASGLYQPQLAQTSPQASQMQNGVRIPPPQPPATAADTVTAQQSVPFQFLISYTDSGFEPHSVTIKTGQTVRFTNNSTGQLWVAASGDPLYPSEQNGCGSSALDSCQPFGPGQFWEFTFTQQGTWSLQNNVNKENMGTVTVQ